MTKEKKKNVLNKLFKGPMRGWTVLVFFFLVLLLGKFFWGLIGVHIPYSEGERIGTIVKVSEKGLIWKTWEVEMVIRSADISYADYWKFSVDSKTENKEEIVKLIKESLVDQKLVLIEYEQMAGSTPWRGKTPYFIKSISVYE